MRNCCWKIMRQAGEEVCLRTAMTRVLLASDAFAKKALTSALARGQKHRDSAHSFARSAKRIGGPTAVATSASIFSSGKFVISKSQSAASSSGRWRWSPSIPFCSEKFGLDLDFWLRFVSWSRRATAHFPHPGMRRALSFDLAPFGLRS